MGPLDAIIQLLLFVCFGVYIVMGLSFFVMGIIYANDDAAVGSTGIYLILLGLLMLIIGGIAVFANLKKIWLILFVIELVNVALFLIIFVLIVCVLMMATGTTDPVRRATDEHWKKTLELLSRPGSDPKDAKNLETTYCSVYGGAACNDYYARAVQNRENDDCDIGQEGKLTVKQALDNCTQLVQGQAYEKCSAVATQCLDCELACKEAAIQDVKDQILPASIFVFILCGYLAIVVVWNNIMIAADDGPQGITKILGLVFNGLLALLAFILVILGAVAAYNADDACQSDTDCVPDSLILIILIGVGLMIVAGVVLAGVQLEISILLRIGTLVMVFLSLLCLLSGLIMGISSGAVMDDMTFYYDSNYPRLRATLESADNSYCKLKKSDCSCLASGGTGVCTGGVQPKVCNDEYTECEPIEGSPFMTSDQLWQNMWSIAAVDAADGAVQSAEPWLANCESSGICIFCDDFYNDVRDGDSTAGVPGLDWRAAVTPANASAPSVEYRWDQAQNTVYNVLKCSGEQAKCAKEVSTYPFRSAVCDGTTAELCNAIDGCVYDVDTTTCVKEGLMEVTNADGTGWSDRIQNMSVSKPSVWTAQMTRCEMALTKHTTVGDSTTSFCKGAGDNVPDADSGLYMADCDSCNGTPEFMFNSGSASPDCLNYFVGHYEHHCISEGSSPSDICRAEFTSVADAAAHVRFMVERAYEDGAPDAFAGNAAKGQSSGFCGYTDEGCKAKIKNSVEGSMSVIGYIGAVFIVFFLAIIFLTLQGIKIYKDGSDDDDDDDDDDGDDDSDE